MVQAPLASVRSFGQLLVQGCLQLIYPAACCVCGRLLPAEGKSFCDACRSALITDPFSSCPRCASTVGPHVPLEEGCAACRDQTFHFESAMRLGPYDGLLKHVILRLKYATGEALAERVGDLWAMSQAARLGELKAHLVIPVPLHWRRRWGRGYNQSQTLARALATQLRLPCRPRWLRRTRNTPRQVDQTATDRRVNVRNAFEARPRPELRGKTILLVDDVLTTGSTASDAARALRAAGAARVIVTVLAHSRG